MQISNFLQSSLMNRQFSFAFLFLLLLIPTLLFSQTRAIRPVNLQIPNGEQIELYKGSYALVIGASDYRDNAWADLSSVPQDVNAVSEALQRHGFEVTQVLNPTESDLIAAMDDFIDNHGYDKDNRLLIYYSGHGHTIERDGRKFGYLVPVDAPSPIDNEKDFFRRAIKVERILSWAKQIESKHALFLFDSCFSGSVLESRAITIPEDISYSTSKPVRQFISAGSANQTVPAVSVFRPTFIRGINGDADLDKDGYVTGVELGMYLQKRVPYYQSGQTPQYGKIRDPYLDEGNFVFELLDSKKEVSVSLEKNVIQPPVAEIKSDRRSEFVAVGRDGTIISSENGFDWISINSGTKLNFADIVFGKNKFVAIGNRGIIYVIEGNTWKEIDLKTDLYLMGITFDGQKFIVVGNKGLLITSEDGENWTSVETGIENLGWSGELWDIATGKSRFVATGRNGTIIYSENGKKWEKVNSGVYSEVLHGIAFGNNKFVVVGENGTVLASSDGKNWSKNPPPTGAKLTDVIFDGNKFLAVGPGIFTSYDGYHWDKKVSASSFITGITYSGKQYVATELNGSILVSSDTVLWKKVKSGVDNHLEKITHSFSSGSVEQSDDCEVVCEGLVGHYTFDDDTLDRSGFKNHGIKSKNIESVSDSKGNSKSAYQFNGKDSFIELRNPITSSDQDFTMMIYMKINKYEHRTNLDCNKGGGNRAGIISSQDQTASLDLMYCTEWGTKFVQHYPRYKYQIWYTNELCQSDCIMEDITFYSDLNRDQYYLISITYNNKLNQTKLYQNARLIDTANWRAYPNGNLIIGGIEYERYPLNGVIDEVRIYNRSISNSEISEIFQSFQ